MTSHARQATDQLTLALINLAARGDGRPRCSDPTISDLFVSESETDRAKAAPLCRGCPVGTECGEVGKHQRFGVWNGVDVTARLGRPKRSAAEAA